MEVEAKFALPDAETFRRLKEINHLAGFALSEGRTRQVSDTYIDTAERTMLASGYACRQRTQNGTIRITLKGLQDAEGAVHRREELEVPLPSPQPPSQWPPGPVRDRVLQLIGDAPLAPLVALQQTRTVRLVRDGQRPVAEFSLDQVHLDAEGGELSYFELEVELGAEGTEDDLATIVSVLQDEWGLSPQKRSKFERALAFSEKARQTKRLLSPQERPICLQIAKRDDLHGRRAQALLSLDEGATQAQASVQANMSARRVRYWLAEFRRRRLGIFPGRIMPETPEIIEAQGQVKSQALSAPKPRRAVAKAQPSASRPSRRLGLVADDSMAEAARKTLAFYLQRMLRHEAGTRLGEDIEELHDMRVATRRMRAALKVFRDYLDRDQMAPFAKGLKATARALGCVRDLDVFWEKTERYLSTLPPEQQNDLDLLKAVWQVERDQARKKMLAYLDGDRYARFKEKFSEFLQRDGAGALPVVSKRGDLLPHRLKHIVPVVVYQRLAVVRAYDEWILGPQVPLKRFHQLRIKTKGLRYTLEFFQEVLGSETKTLIAKIKALQDHLGDLQDAVVASSLLRDFLTWGTWGHAERKGRTESLPAEPIVAPGVASYLAARQTGIQHLLKTFPQTWAQIQSPEFSQLVASALATL